MFSEVQPALLTGLVLSHSGSVLEPVGTACVWQGVSSWPLLTEAIPAASPLPNTCHVNSTYVMLPHTGCWFYTVLHQKHYTELPEGNVSLFHLLCVTVIWLWSFLLWALFFKAAILFSCFMLFVIQTVYTWISLGLTEVQSESTSVSNKVWVTNSAALSKYPGLPIKLLHVWPCCLCFINTPVVTAVCRHCLPHTLNKNDSRWLFITA